MNKYKILLSFGLFFCTLLPSNTTLALTKDLAVLGADYNYDSLTRLNDSGYTFEHENVQDVPSIDCFAVYQIVNISHYDSKPFLFNASKQLFSYETSGASCHIWLSMVAHKEWISLSLPTC